MTQLAMQATWPDRTVVLIWQDGHVSGDPEAVEKLQRTATDFEGYSVPSLWGFTHHDHLANPYSAAVLMEMVLGRDAKVIAGGVPPLPEPEDGAIL